MNRRRYLAVCGAVVAASGCLGAGDEPPEDPREEIGYYIEEGANNDGAWVEEIESIGAGETDDGSGYDASLEYELEYQSSNDSDAVYEENANWTAYYVCRAVFEQDLDVEQLRLTASIPTVDQQGNEGESVISEIVMVAETAEDITWDNIGAEEIPSNAERYSFEPV